MAAKEIEMFAYLRDRHRALDRSRGVPMKS
jgi:hypothetical protein